METSEVVGLVRVWARRSCASGGVEIITDEYDDAKNSDGGVVVSDDMASLANRYPRADR